MAELYDNARLANSQYVPQFVGSNFETLKDAADKLDLRYRQNREMSDRLAIAMANDKYHQADQAIGDKIYNDFSTTIDEVAKSDQNFENSTGIIANKARDYQTNRDRILALENNKKYEEYVAKKQELGADAQDFTKAYTGIRNEDGTTNRFNHQLEKKLDYDKQKETYFNQIEADLRQQGYSQDVINKEFLKSTITGGISDTKIGNYIKEAMNRHKTTAEYDQEKRALVRDGLSPEEADKSIRRSLLSTGLERVHNMSKLDLQRHSEAYNNGLFNNIPEAEPFVPTIPGMPKTNTVRQPLTSVDSKFWKDQNSGKLYQLYDKQGNPVTPEQAQQTQLLMREGTGGFGGSIDELYDKKEVAPHDPTVPGSYEYQHNYIANNASERQKNILKQSQGKKESYTVEDFKKMYEEADKSNAKVVSSGEVLTEKNTPIYENYLKGAGLNAPTILEGETEPRTLKDIISNMKLDSKDKVEFVPSLLNRVSPNSQMGANIEGTIYVNGQPTKSFATRLSDQFDNASTELNDILQHSLYQGADTYTKDRPRVSDNIIRSEDGTAYAPVYYTTTVPTGNSKNPFDTEVHVGVAKIGQNPDGSPTIEQPEYNGESYTAKEFQAKQTEISKRKLKNTYQSGQMHDLDFKSTGRE